jgi:histidinol-phosphate aminotransferase
VDVLCLINIIILILYNESPKILTYFVFISSMILIGNLISGRNELNDLDLVLHYDEYRNDKERRERSKRSKGKMSWEQNVRTVVPYTPGEQPNRPEMIKLNTNECPYPPSPKVQEALEALEAARLRLYPDPAAKKLVQALADYYKVDTSNVFVGVGSDDVLAMAFLTFFNDRKKPILFPDITYSFYDVWANLYRIPYETQPLDEEFRIIPDDYKQPNGGIIFPNPNAPTGAFLPLDKVEDIIRANQEVVVIVDEAYVDFGGKSVIPLVDKYDNLLVVQTFSKSRAMAGMRIGFAIGSKKLIQYLNDVKFSFNSYTMDHVTIETGVAAIRDDVYFKETVDKIIKTRERVSKELRALGFKFADSSANFLFVTHDKYAAVELQKELRKHDIYVRHFDAERIDNYLRITIGTDDEMDSLLALLKNIMKQEGK